MLNHQAENHDDNALGLIKVGRFPNWVWSLPFSKDHVSTTSLYRNNCPKDIPGIISHSQWIAGGSQETILGVFWGVLAAQAVKWGHSSSSSMFQGLCGPFSGQPWSESFSSAHLPITMTPWCSHHSGAWNQAAMASKIMSQDQPSMSCLPLCPGCNYTQVTNTKDVFFVGAWLKLCICSVSVWLCILRETACPKFWMSVFWRKSILEGHPWQSDSLVTSWADRLSGKPGFWECKNNCVGH